MKHVTLLLVAALVAAAAAADQVTFKDGTRTSGTVVSVDATTVVVESELGRQELRRDAVRTIELGSVLTTGIADRTFTSKDYRGRFVAPEGWAIYKEPGLDFAAKKGSWIAISRSLPLEGMQDGGESLMSGAVAGMTVNMQGSTAGEPQAATWGGQKATRVDLTSPQVNLAVYFLHLPNHFVLFAVGAVPAEYSAAAAAATLAEWEQGFALIPD